MLKSKEKTAVLASLLLLAHWTQTGTETALGDGERASPAYLLFSITDRVALGQRGFVFGLMFRS
jgi:hypothetical protein